MSDAPDPPRKFYGLKPREFEAVNAPIRAAGEQPQEGEKGPIDVRDLFKSGASVGTPKGSLPQQNVVRENDVHAILKQNLVHANALGLNDITPRPRRRSRRKRDYFLTIIVVNLIGGCVISWGRGNVMVMAYAAAGMIILNLGFTWVMWFVMDDY